MLKSSMIQRRLQNVEHIAVIYRTSAPVASLGLVSPGAATEGVAPIFY